MKLIIKGNPITKKNHQRIITNRKTHVPMVIPSEQYTNYEKMALRSLTPLDVPIDFPVNVDCKYYMETRRRCDLVNLQEATLDILVRAEILADDNCKIVWSMDGSRVFYDKDNPRVEIEITKVVEE